MFEGDKDEIGTAPKPDPISIDIDKTSTTSSLPLVADTKDILASSYSSSFEISISDILKICVCVCVFFVYNLLRRSWLLVI